MKALSRIAVWLSRFVLLFATIVFSAISVKYLGNPVGTTAPFKITLGSAAAITNMRVGFGAFPLGFALITFSCLLRRRHIEGLYCVMTIVGVATAARTLGIVVDGAASESFKVLLPEVAMLTLSILGLFLELGQRRRGPFQLAGSQQVLQRQI